MRRLSAFESELSLESSIDEGLSALQYLWYRYLAAGWFVLAATLSALRFLG